MKYKWKEKHFRELLSKEINECDKNDLNKMIDLLHDRIDLDFFGITNNSEHDTFRTRYQRYHEGIECLDENLIQFASSIFSIEKEENNIFTYIEDNDYKLSNEDLIEFAYEILKTLNDKYVLSGICFCLFEDFIAVINCLSIHIFAKVLKEFCLSGL